MTAHAQRFAQQPSIPPHIAFSVTSRRLELIILPTEKCNLRCTYCYEDFELGRMPPETREGIKNLITQRAEDLNVLELSWFGGEPLLAAPDIFDICRHAQEQARLHPQMRVLSSMTTNGVLLTAGLARQLDELGVKSYQISLDGPRDLHDKSRITAKGGGTFDAIWGNLTALAATDIPFHIILRVHYRLETWTQTQVLVDEINAAFGGDSRFTVLFKPIVALGGKNDASISRLSSAQKKDIQQALEDRVQRPAGTAVEQGSPDSERAGAPVCYAAQANSLVIRADGAINKCTVALADDRNAIGRINRDGTLSIDSAKLRPWLRGIETQEPFELGCPYASHMKNWVPAQRTHPVFPIMAEHTAASAKH